MPDHRNVLVVDDDPIICTVAAAYLSKAGWTPETVCTPCEALCLSESKRFTVLVTDLQLETNWDGITLFKAIRERQPFMRGILLSAHVDYATILRVIEAGFDDCLIKPVNETICATVERSGQSFARWTDRIHSLRNLQRERHG